MGKVKIKGIELTPSDVCNVVSDMLNVFGDKNSREFLDAMAKEHRTLQQLFTGLCMKWIEKKANMKDFDGRDSASVDLCREIIEKFPNRHLPLV